MIFLLIGLINMKNRLFLIKEIYCLEKIKQAINDYKNLAVIELKEDENYYYCDFKETYYALNLTVNEFENYLIGLTYK